MKYFLDTEFLEGTQKKLFGETKPTIDLISIGIVAEDGREYYAISKDFNLKEAWNRYDLKTRNDAGGNTFQYKVYWIRDNVLKPIWEELRNKPNSKRIDFNGNSKDNYFSYNSLKYLIKRYGKTNKQIAKEIIRFVGYEDHSKWFRDSKEGNYITEITSEFNKNGIHFYGYYSDYDWVCFCWLFGRMVDLPKGFPMVAFDIQQQIEEYNVDKEQLLKEVPQENIHNSLEDARWNYKAYNRIQHKINNNV